MIEENEFFLKSYFFVKVVLNGVCQQNCVNESYAFLLCEVCFVRLKENNELEIREMKDGQRTFDRPAGITFLMNRPPLRLKFPGNPAMLQKL